ncbi:MAG: hypothetical protein JL50_01135 [Peptococcaceae bacterium BICA1-7]|nr:MAG: hypothetical protein JL50_01135 [Peptococcaceae bacterium BICA1-7]
MSKLKKISHILIALILAAAAGGLVWYYVKVSVPSEKVVVATGKLPIGTVIGEQNVTIREYPASAIPSEAETSLDKVVGKTIVSGTVFPGDVIRKGHMASDMGSLKTVLTSMAPGKEAIDLPADTASGLKGVAAGDLVNVYTEITVGKDTTEVECVAAGAVILKVPLGSTDKDNSLAGQKSTGSFIIAVTPEEAQKVAAGNVTGKKFSLSLLPPKGGQ